ncbi:MAG: hypothetical protein LBE24_00730 [Methylobacillus sp.]|jgi:sulfur relay (sulfurtransferase) DsrF/TusC family protein|nr:hypothetical protein [Methylobacillus sp.]
MMKTAAIVIAFAFGMSSLPATAAYLDIYPGMVALEGDQLVMTRCDLAATRYVLVDGEGNTDSLIKQLPAEIKDRNYHVIVNVVAEYREQDGKHYLYVDSLPDIKVGKESCLLIDLIDK